jgi:hypothetical protein
MKKSTTMLANTLVTGALVMQGAIGNAQGGPSSGAASNEAIRPFHVNVPEEQLADLKRRILATRWPDPEIVKDESQGVQFATMQALAKYWSIGKCMTGSSRIRICLPMIFYFLQHNSSVST